MTAMDYAHRVGSLAKPHKVNGASRHLIDADCDYVDGAFRLSSLPPKLPILFTVRFTAPADFTPGDVFTLKGQEYAVKTRNMEDPEGKLFSAGAVAQCDIDMERELAFFTAGSVESAQSCGCRYQTGTLSFFIDPDGDDSLNNPGTADSPFKTLAGAKNAVSQRYIFTSMGELVYSINPGTYAVEGAELDAFCIATHPKAINFRASDPNNKPLLVTGDRFSVERGLRVYADLRLEFGGIYGITVGNHARTRLQGVEMIARASNSRFLYAVHYGIISIERNLTLDGSGNAIDHALGCHYGEIYRLSTPVVNIKNMPSVTAFAWCHSGYLYLPHMTFTGTTSGKRYHAHHGGVIDTNGHGVNYLPGTIAGTTATNGIYV